MKINEIFYSIQGEGANAGKAAVFVRFSGCNLKCPFCDTDFKDFKEYTEMELVDEVMKVAGKCRFLVFTGGEPSLQLTPYLVSLMQQEGFRVAVETNGTRPLPHNIDWITLSPKHFFVGDAAAKIVLAFANELKCVFDGENEIDDCGVAAEHYYVQPCDTGDEQKNREIIKKCVEYVKDHPQWAISLQTHKIINVR